ncbi:MAG TPA: DoxX-like family protein [Candidatus Saccharimonadales bacterium]|nr:DoxX-like family protein [Candidatus Saccharimonadales bacterium]
MNVLLHSDSFHAILQIVIGCVWVFHGLYSKILNGIPRHRQIVERVLGATYGGVATKAIGLLEVLVGVWVFTGWQSIACAALQTAALVAMNTLEIMKARELLISALGMVILNLGFLTLVWHWAIFASKS